MNNSADKLQAGVRTVGAVAVLSLGFLLSSCSPESSTEPGHIEPTAEANPTHSVPVKEDGYTTLPVYMVAGSQYSFEFPDESRTTLSCGEQMVLINSVPTRTNDPVEASLAYLLDNEQFYHGSPSLMNPLVGSTTVEVTSVAEQAQTVTVELSGELYTRGGCESAQLIAQLEMTAQAASGADEVEILINGTPVRESLGVAEPYSVAP